MKWSQRRITWSISCRSRSFWPLPHIECVAKFFVLLETHPIRQTTHENRIVTVYAGCARCEWFDALRRNEGFNLAIINPDLMKSIADKIKDSSRDEEMAVVSIPPLFFALLGTRNNANICFLFFPFLSCSFSLSGWPTCCCFVILITLCYHYLLSPLLGGGGGAIHCLLCCRTVPFAVLMLCWCYRCHGVVLSKSQLHVALGKSMVS